MPYCNHLWLRSKASLAISKVYMNTTYQDIHHARTRLKLASCMQHVERVTLSRLMPDASFVLKKATSTLTIKEPAFQDIVILYRRKVDDAPKQDEHDEVHEKYDKVNQICLLIMLMQMKMLPSDVAFCFFAFPDCFVWALRSSA